MNLTLDVYCVVQPPQISLNNTINDIGNTTKIINMVKMLILRQHDEYEDDEDVAAAVVFFLINGSFKSSRISGRHIVVFVLCLVDLGRIRLNVTRVVTVKGTERNVDVVSTNLMIQASTNQVSSSCFLDLAFLLCE